MKSNHTQEPWELRGDRVVAPGADRAIASLISYGFDDPEVLPNGRLLAAAPRLLAALQLMLEARIDPMGGRAYEADVAAHAAIAQATLPAPL